MHCLITIVTVINNTVDVDAKDKYDMTAFDYFTDDNHNKNSCYDSVKEMLCGNNNFYKIKSARKL